MRILSDFDIDSKRFSLPVEPRGIEACSARWRALQRGAILGARLDQTVRDCVAFCCLTDVTARCLLLLAR